MPRHDLHLPTNPNIPGSGSEPKQASPFDQPIWDRIGSDYARDHVSGQRTTASEEPVRERYRGTYEQYRLRRDQFMEPMQNHDLVRNEFIPTREYQRQVQEFLSRVPHVTTDQS